MALKMEKGCAVHVPYESAWGHLDKHAGKGHAPRKY